MLKCTPRDSLYFKLSLFIPLKGQTKSRFFFLPVNNRVLFNVVWPCSCEEQFCFSNLAYYDSDMVFQFFCSLFEVTCYDVDGCLNLGTSEIGYHVHLVKHSTRVGVLLFAVLHGAGSQTNLGYP